MGATVSDLVTTAVLAAYQTVPVGVKEYELA
jgi:hypothetical protein